MSVIQLIIMALAPIAAIVAYILLTSFILGALVSVVLALILYSVFNIILPLQNKLSIWEQFKQAFFVVGFTEEFSKFLIVLLCIGIAL